MQTVVLTFDSGFTPLLPTVLRGHPVVRAQAEGATLEHTIEALGVPYIEIDQMLVGGRAMALEALLPTRGHVAVSAVEPFLPAAPPHLLYDVHLGATARLLRMAGLDTAYDNNCADAVIGALAYEEDRIMLSRDHEFLKRCGIRRGAFICAREPQAQVREIATRLRLADVAKSFSRCLRCNALLRMLSPEEASASMLPCARECQQFFSTCDVRRRVYQPGLYQARMNVVLADMLWSETGASADSAETAERMPRIDGAGA